MDDVLDISLGAIRKANQRTFHTGPGLRQFLRSSQPLGEPRASLLQLIQFEEHKMARVSKRETAFDVGGFLNSVDGGRTVAAYEPNQTIFAQGDAADAVCYIQIGKVKVSVVSEQGREAVVALHGQGDFFGEGCLNGHTMRTSSVVALTACHIMRIEKRAMLKVLRGRPKFSEMFMLHLLARNSRLEEDLVDQLFNSSEKRLARILLLMANFGKEGKPEPIIPKISQETLAEMVGTTRSRVSKFMNKFRKLGFISYNGTIEVHQSLLNVVLHDSPHIRNAAKKPD